MTITTTKTTVFSLFLLFASVSGHATRLMLIETNKAQIANIQPIIRFVPEAKIPRDGRAMTILNEMNVRFAITPIFNETFDEHVTDANLVFCRLCRVRILTLNF